MREDAQRNGRVEAQRRRSAHELQDRRTHIRPHTGEVRRCAAAELNDAARLLQGSVREILAAHLHRAPGNEAGKLAEPALQRSRVVVRSLDVTPRLPVVVVQRLVRMRRHELRHRERDGDDKPTGKVLQRNGPHRPPNRQAGSET